MSTAKFSDDFKRDAVHQIVERDYPDAPYSADISAGEKTAQIKTPEFPPGSWFVEILTA